MSASAGRQAEAPTPETLAAAGWKQRQLPGFIQAAGPLWTRRDGDGWTYGILAGPSHANPAGRVHGGVLATLADHAVSIGAWEAVGRRPCVTVQLDTHFLAAATPGQFIEARTRVVRATRSLVFMQAALAVGDAEIATASAVLKVVEPPVDGR